MNILFYDVMSPTLFTDQSLQEGALRGTEGTIVRVAHQLAKTHQVFVASHHRQASADVVSSDVHYISLATAHQLQPDVVILLRDYRLLSFITECYPHAKRFYWLHNLPPKHFYHIKSDLIKGEYQLIAVSNFHRSTLIKRLKGRWYQRLFHWDWKSLNIPIHVIYNPLDDSWHPNNTPFRPHQLIFTSASTKGLDEILYLFQHVRRYNPEYELLIVCPNKHQLKHVPSHVSILPPQPQHQLLQYIRESFCVFYPQAKRKETFGFVYAQANAAGTPVLAHDFGAAREVLSDECQLVNGNDILAIVEKLKAWQLNRPKVQAKPEFRLQAVMRRWSEVLSTTHHRT